MKNEYILKLTPAEITHLISLLHDNEDEGSYYGNEKQFRKRSAHLITKLTFIKDDQE